MESCRRENRRDPQRCNTEHGMAISMVGVLTMKTVIVIIPLFASFLFAQEQSRIETRTTTKTSWNGTLVDAACQTTRTERTETTRTPDQIGGVRTTTQTTTERVDCPVTTTTTTFGLLTRDGKFVRFDDPSNTRVVEIVRSNRAFNLAERGPI